ncbi:MAG: LamG domain-containing protein [Candidatus Izemoplasmatales bacterium]
MSIYETKYNPFSKHVQWVLQQNKDTKLDEGGVNEISASEIKSMFYNIILNAFRLAIQGSLTIFNMKDGIIDEYADESGIDTVSSEGQEYNSDNHYYQPSQDLFDIYTSLLLHCDGVADTLANSPTDESRYSQSATGDNLYYRSTAKVFGDTGFRFFDSMLNIDISDELKLGGELYWTIDLWFKNTLSLGTILSNFDSSPGGVGCSWMLRMQPDGQNLEFAYTTADYAEPYYFETLITVPDFTVVNGTWYHVAIVRNNTTIKIYINGVEKTSIAIGSELLYVPTCPVFMGYFRKQGGYDAYWGKWRGDADEIRISKGIARWTANFTPPSAQYEPEAMNMILISKQFLANNTPDSARIVIFEEDVDAITLNTDLKAYISRDDGDTWAEATLQDEGEQLDGKRTLTSLIDISGQPSNTKILYKCQSFNLKNLKIHGTSLFWN